MTTITEQMIETAEITLPKPFVNALGITPEQPEVEMVLDGDQIIIKKKA